MDFFFRVFNWEKNKKQVSRSKKAKKRKKKFLVEKENVVGREFTADKTFDDICKEKKNTPILRLGPKKLLRKNRKYVESPNKVQIFTKRNETLIHFPTFYNAYA